MVFKDKLEALSVIANDIDNPMEFLDQIRWGKPSLIKQLDAGIEHDLFTHEYKVPEGFTKQTFRDCLREVLEGGLVKFNERKALYTYLSAEVEDYLSMWDSLPTQVCLLLAYIVRDILDEHPDLVRDGLEITLNRAKRQYYRNQIKFATTYPDEVVTPENGLTMNQHLQYLYAEEGIAAVDVESNTAREVLNKEYIERAVRTLGSLKTLVPLISDIEDTTEDEEGFDIKDAIDATNDVASSFDKLYNYTKGCLAYAY